jgi:hypothetical protein
MKPKTKKKESDFFELLLRDDTGHKMFKSKGKTVFYDMNEFLKEKGVLIARKRTPKNK